MIAARAWQALYVAAMTTSILGAIMADVPAALGALPVSLVAYVQWQWNRDGRPDTFGTTNGASNE